MNEKILKIVTEARKYAWENETHWSANAEREKLFEEKFAELIVKECAKVAAKVGEGYVQMGYVVPHECSDKIKEHFGVDDE